MVSTGPILLVDNSEADYFALSRALARGAVSNEVIPFYFAEELISYMELARQKMKAWPALVILDVNLSGMSGLEALKALKAGPAPQPRTFIVSHCNVEDGIRAEAEAGGAKACMTKPVSPSDWARFCATVQNLLQPRHEEKHEAA